MYSADCDKWSSGKFYGWDSSDDSTATLWTDKGDLFLKGVTKNEDGTISATGCYGKLGSWYGWSQDQNSDGVVFTCSTQNADGSYDFTLELSNGEVCTGKFYDL